MKAIHPAGFGGPEVLQIADYPAPVPQEGELLVQVKATALNRADLLQRRGLYPPPAGVPDILGLEMAGTVLAAGPETAGFREGDRICALLPGGGYAEQAVIPANMAIPLPEHFSFEQGAAIPETFLTAFLNLFQLGGLQPGQHVLVHAGASGVGTAALQLIREAGAVAYATAGSERKLACCKELGAAAGWDYHTGDFAPWVLAQTGGRGVDLVLDFVGAPYFHSNLRALALDGKLIVIGTLGGGKVDSVQLSELLARRLQIIGTALRSRSAADKAALTSAFKDFALPRLRDGRLKPVIDTVFDWRDAAKAHAYMETNRSIGKIVLQIT